MTALAFALVVLTGCGSTESGGGSASGSVHYGTGFYDPWYYGGYDDDPDIIVTPPRPEPPIAKPPPVSAPRPTPMPSIPSRPMPRGR